MNSKARKIISWAVLVGALALFAGATWLIRCRILASEEAVNEAADLGDWQTVRRLVSWRHSLAKVESTGGGNLIHLAVLARRRDMVPFLASYGADVNAVGWFTSPDPYYQDNTPLTLAIGLRDAEMVECLLKNGAAPSAGVALYPQPNSNFTKTATYPLSYARSLGLHDIEALLKKYGAKEPPATPAHAPAAVPAPAVSANATP